MVGEVIVFFFLLVEVCSSSDSGRIILFLESTVWPCKDLNTSSQRVDGLFERSILLLQIKMLLLNQPQGIHIILRLNELALIVSWYLLSKVLLCLLKIAPIFRAYAPDILSMVAM